MIRDLGYGKDVVNYINTCNGGYLMEKIRTISTPVVYDSEPRTDAHSMIGKSNYTLAERCKRLYENKESVKRLQMQILK